MNKAVNYLNGLTWHDSILDDVTINRTNSADQAVLNLHMFMGDDVPYRKLTLTFNDCYLISTSMCGGVDYGSEGEMIHEALAQNKHPQIDDVVTRWKDVLELNNLLHFSITLSSTNSEIALVFKSITVDQDEPI